MSIAFLPLLAKGGETTPGYTSSIINVSSISGAMKGNSSGQFAYASSKAATTHLSRMLATVFQKTKVRVNVIAPGVFPSEVSECVVYICTSVAHYVLDDHRRVWRGQQVCHRSEDVESCWYDTFTSLFFFSLTALGRPGKDTDMAATVLFLAGPGGVFYNEQIVYPDGGTSHTHILCPIRLLTLYRPNSCFTGDKLESRQVLSWRTVLQVTNIKPTSHIHLMC
jgi:NAD(P)-dependent dehydrogenase (short-subunit alcohol dehydrogenase family)